MKKYLLLLALVCLLGNRGLAQNGFYATETIDFTGWSYNPNDYNRANVNVSWSNNNNNITSITSSDSNISLTRTYTGRFSLNNDGSERWRMWGSGTFQVTYLQRDNSNTNFFFYLHDMKKGDVVTIWGENGDATGEKGCRVQNNSNRNGELMQFNEDNPDEGQQFVVADNGDVTLQFFGQYSGIRKITIVSRVSHYDYDPGYEEYDMYDEFSENDPKKCRLEENNGRPYTYYTTSNADFQLNGQTARYIILHDSKITANNRIAIDKSDTWRFNYGLRAPWSENNNTWSNFSVCNLREGDRVVFSYTGDAPIFSSVGGSSTYNGCKAFADKYNDGIFNSDEDVYLVPGAEPEKDWNRPEGAIGREDNDCNSADVTLQYTQAYVIMEDGHLDLAILPSTRIVKIKIYSDHQASMVDEYDADSYTAKFNITGELQAKEHIMPGGLEVHVGSDDASQHAHVVTSANGPVSIVNGVDGFKLPGMSRNEETGNLQFQFDLANNIPTTGTFYKFMPLEEGKMSLTFQATSMNYYTYGLDGDAVYYGNVANYGDNNWDVVNDRPNEQTVNVACPYYLVKVEKNGRKTVTTINAIWNGTEYTITDIDVKADETYYLYGGWNTTDVSFTAPGQGNNTLEYFPYGAGNGGAQKACGVAKLLEVVFNPKKYIYPLAKWVPNGTTAVKTGNGVPNPDTFETEYVLADLYGYNDRTKITVKKMSGNITACHPYLVFDDPDDNHHSKLMIDGITFDETNGGKDKGGTILIKIGEPNKKSDPVYTLTIAYSTNPIYDGNSGTGTRGHIWDYSSNSLHGLEWKAPHQANGAQTKDYGHYFANYFAADLSNYSSADEVFKGLTPSGSGLLSEELSGNNSDWMFNYNLVNAGNLYDPLFSNKYDLEGDNADLIWETEGTVFNTSANASVMFNEFTGDDIHESTVDPDRYVGILNGGEFRIPWLMPNDRVIIWMGVGKGAFNDHAVFSIRNAYDALHNPIYCEYDEENKVWKYDEYIVGGSQWTIGGSYTGDGKNDYRGCYHFFATGHDGGPADMVFKMVGGNLCKIYKIQIYRGDRIITNEVVGITLDEDGKPTGNHNNYLLWSRAADPNDNSGADKGPDYNWTLKYFGKDQKLADGNGTKGQKNEIVAQTGNINKTISTDAATNTFTYEHGTDEIGTFRMRGKDMEKNMNYVADYADHNVTVALQETQKYPYTWDFKDMVIYDNASFVAEDAIGPSKHDWFIPNTTDEDEIAAWDEAWNTSYEKSSEDLSLWVGKNGTYELRLNSQEDQTTSNPMEKDNIFQTATQNYDGNQLWAGGQVVPETKGLWFYTDNNNREAGQWKITNKGMALNGSTGWAHKMVVPNVPKNAAVYLRMVATKNANFTEQFKTDNENCEVFGITQVPSATDEWIFAILNKGEKQNLVLSFDGYRLLKLAVSEDPKTVNKKGYASESHKRVLDHSLTSFFTGKNIKAYLAKNYNESASTIDLVEIERPMPAATENGDNVGSVLYNNDYYKDEDNVEHGQVDILDGGFHLFVPDMHDYTGDPNDFENMVTDELEDTSGNLMLSYNAGATSNATIPQKIGSSIVYVLSYQYFEHDKDGLTVNDANEAQVEAFYRVAKNGAGIKPNSAYITFSSPSQAKVSFLWEDELFGETNNGIATGISEATDQGTRKMEWYSLDGRKLNGAPTAKGLYIVNGKKVLVK